MRVHHRMPGISNRDERIENEGQQRIEKRKDELPDFEAVNRARKDHPMDKDRAHDVPGRDRISETGAGRGTDHKGH
jgi:hypothetical protein